MEKLLTVQEASVYLKVSPCTIYRYSKRGLLPHFKTGFGLRYKLEDITNYLSRHKREGLVYKKISKMILTKPFAINIDKAKGGVELSKGKSKARHNFSYGAIYKRRYKSGKIRWYLDYYDSTGKRIQRVAAHAETKEEAVIALKNAVLQEHSAGYGVKERKQRVKFAEFSNIYLENYAKVNKKSWRGDKYRIEAHMKPFFINFELQDINPLLIEKYKAERLKTGVTKSTVNREITIMKKMFNLAIDWDFTDNNPILKVKLFSEKDTMKERILTEEEEVKLLAESPDYLKPILVVALNTGMRRGEIFNLKWSQVDLDKRNIIVEQTKSGKNRIIPINDYLYQELLKVKNQNEKSEYVFPNQETGKPFTEVKKSFKNACRKAGINDLRFHDLRHTFATRLIQSGVDIITVKDLLGHFSVRITQRYTHSNQNQKKKAVEILAKKSLRRVENSENLLHMRYIN